MDLGNNENVLLDWSDDKTLHIKNPMYSISVLIYCWGESLLQKDLAEENKSTNELKIKEKSQGQTSARKKAVGLFF